MTELEGPHKTRKKRFQIREWYDVLVLVGLVLALLAGALANLDLFGLALCLAIIGGVEARISKLGPGETWDSHRSWVDRRRPTSLSRLSEAIGATILVWTILDIL